MAGKVANIKVYSPLQLLCNLTGLKPVICHYSYNLSLATMYADRIKGNKRYGNTN